MPSAALPCGRLLVPVSCARSTLARNTYIVLVTPNALYAANKPYSLCSLAFTGLPDASTAKFGEPNNVTRSRWLVTVISLSALAIVVPAANVPLGVSLSWAVASNTNGTDPA